MLECSRFSNFIVDFVVNCNHLSRLKMAWHLSVALQESREVQSSTRLQLSALSASRASWPTALGQLQQMQEVNLAAQRSNKNLPTRCLMFCLAIKNAFEIAWYFQKKSVFKRRDNGCLCQVCQVNLISFC